MLSLTRVYTEIVHFAIRITLAKILTTIYYESTHCLQLSTTPTDTLLHKKYTDIYLFFLNNSIHRFSFDFCGFCQITLLINCIHLIS